MRAPQKHSGREDSLYIGMRSLDLRAMSKDLLSSLFLMLERLMLTNGSDMCCRSMPGMA